MYGIRNKHFIYFGTADSKKTQAKLVYYFVSMFVYELQIEWK
jgi:hypothetical protein